MSDPRTRCGQATCVAAVVTAEGVKVTSTVEDNHGVVVFTRAEWDAFLEQVKTGKWDDTLSTLGKVHDFA